MSKKICVSQIISTHEASKLVLFVVEREAGESVHHAVMRWFDSTPEGKSVIEKFRINEVLPSYGAYLFEYYLKLS